MRCGQSNTIETSEVFFQSHTLTFLQNRSAVGAISDIGIVEKTFDESKETSLIVRCFVAGFDGGTASG